MHQDYITLHRISDTYLYEEAQKFLSRIGVDAPDNAQLSGLLTFSRTWQELTIFVKHQAQRKWNKKREHYKIFYDQLNRYLEQDLKQCIQREFNAHLSSMTRRERNDFIFQWLQMLAQEFVQHLIVHAQWERSKD